MHSLFNSAGITGRNFQNNAVILTLFVVSIQSLIQTLKLEVERSRHCDVIGHGVSFAIIISKYV